MNMNLLANNKNRMISPLLLNPNNFNNYFYTCINLPILLGGNQKDTPLINNNFSNINPFIQPSYFNLKNPIFENNLNINKFGVQNSVNSDINTNNNLTLKMDPLLNTNYKCPFINNGNIFKNFNSINYFGISPKTIIDNNLNNVQTQNSFQIPYQIKSNNKNNIIINDSDEITSNSEFKESNNLKKENINYNKNESSSNVFKLILKKKRGRFVSNINNEKRQKRTHSATDYDNILRKVQVHYLTFIINLNNEILANFFPENKELRFQNLSYDIKKNVKHSYVENLKNLKLGEILRLKASSKFKKYNLDTINIDIYSKVCALNPFFKDFYQINYLDFFNEYYIQDTRTFIFDGKEITFSEKTKFFNDLLKKNLFSADKMKQIINTQYNYKNNDIFIVNKIR